MKKRDLDALLNLVFAAGGVWLGWRLLQMLSPHADPAQFADAARRCFGDEPREVELPEFATPPDEPDVIPLRRGADGIYQTTVQ